MLGGTRERPGMSCSNQCNGGGGNIFSCLPGFYSFRTTCYQTTRPLVLNVCRCAPQEAVGQPPIDRAEIGRSGEAKRPTSDPPQNKRAARSRRLAIRKLRWEGSARRPRQPPRCRRRRRTHRRPRALVFINYYPILTPCNYYIYHHHYYHYY